MIQGYRCYRLANIPFRVMYLYTRYQKVFRQLRSVVVSTPAPVCLHEINVSGFGWPVRSVFNHVAVALPARRLFFTTGVHGLSSISGECHAEFLDMRSGYLKRAISMLHFLQGCFTHGFRINSCEENSSFS